MNLNSIKELRNKTGAGMMQCKQALAENGGDLKKAIETLRLKGQLVANKKATRDTKEGLIVSYIHTGNKLGILLEINCETDFVARELEFKLLAKNIAMQIAASSDIEFISIDQIPEGIRNKEWDFEQQKPDLIGKSEEIKNKIINGRLSKTLQKKNLLEQAYIKDTSITVNDLIQQKIVLFGENIKIKRFIRFKLGE